MNKKFNVFKNTTYVTDDYISSPILLLFIESIMIAIYDTSLLLGSLVNAFVHWFFGTSVYGLLSIRHHLFVFYYRCIRLSHHVIDTALVSLSNENSPDNTSSVSKVWRRGKLLSNFVLEILQQFVMVFPDFYYKGVMFFHEVL